MNILPKDLQSERNQKNSLMYFLKRIETKLRRIKRVGTTKTTEKFSRRGPGCGKSSVKH